MSNLWASLYAVAERLNLMETRVAELERTIADLEQKLRDARGN